MIPELETERLVLRPLAPNDAEQTQKLFPHWEIVRFLTARIPWPFPPDGVAEYYRNVALPAIAAGDLWAWTLRPRSDPGQIIGALDLRREEDHNRGFWLALPWHGQGLMLEAAEAANDYWFGALGATVLRTVKAAQNLASRRISERTGMRLICTTEYDFVSGRLPAELWELKAAEWAAWKQHSAPTSRAGTPEA